MALVYNLKDILKIMESKEEISIISFKNEFKVNIPLQSFKKLVTLMSLTMEDSLRYVNIQNNVYQTEEKHYIEGDNDKLEKILDGKESFLFLPKFDPTTMDDNDKMIFGIDISNKSFKKISQLMDNELCYMFDYLECQLTLTSEIEFLEKKKIVEERKKIFIKFGIFLKTKINFLTVKFPNENEDDIQKDSFLNIAKKCGLSSNEIYKIVSLEILSKSSKSGKNTINLYDFKLNENKRDSVIGTTLLFFKELDYFPNKLNQMDLAEAGANDFNEAFNLYNKIQDNINKVKTNTIKFCNEPSNVYFQLSDIEQNTYLINQKYIDSVFDSGDCLPDTLIIKDINGDEHTFNTEEIQKDNNGYVLIKSKNDENEIICNNFKSTVKNLKSIKKPFEIDLYDNTTKNVSLNELILKTLRNNDKEEVLSQIKKFQDFDNNRNNIIDDFSNEEYSYVEVKPNQLCNSSLLSDIVSQNRLSCNINNALDNNLVNVTKEEANKMKDIEDSKYMVIMVDDKEKIVSKNELGDAINEWEQDNSIFTITEYTPEGKVKSDINLNDIQIVSIPKEELPEEESKEDNIEKQQEENEQNNKNVESKDIISQKPKEKLRATTNKEKEIKDNRNIDEHNNIIEQSKEEQKALDKEPIEVSENKLSSKEEISSNNNQKKNKEEIPIVTLKDKIKPTKEEKSKESKRLLSELNNNVNYIQMRDINKNKIIVSDKQKQKLKNIKGNISTYDVFAKERNDNNAIKKVTKENLNDNNNLILIEVYEYEGANVIKKYMIIRKSLENQLNENDNDIIELQNEDFDNIKVKKEQIHVIEPEDKDIPIQGDLIKDLISNKINKTFYLVPDDNNNMKYIRTEYIHLIKEDKPKIPLDKYTVYDLDNKDVIIPKYVVNKNQLDEYVLIYENGISHLVLKKELLKPPVNGIYQFTLENMKKIDVNYKDINIPRINQDINKLPLQKEDPLIIELRNKRNKLSKLNINDEYVKVMDENNNKIYINKRYEEDIIKLQKNSQDTGTFNVRDYYNKEYKIKYDEIENLDKNKNYVPININNNEHELVLKEELIHKFNLVISPKEEININSALDEKKVIKEQNKNIEIENIKEYIKPTQNITGIKRNKSDSYFFGLFKTILGLDVNENNKNTTKKLNDLMKNKLINGQKDLKNRKLKGKKLFKIRTVIINKNEE